MNKNSSIVPTLVALLTLLVGLLAGAVFFSDTEYVNVPGETKLVEVVKNVSVEVPVADASAYLDNALSDFLKEVKDEDLANTCDGDEYGFSDISVDRVYDEYSVEFGDKDNEEVTVNFEVKLKYDEADVRSCRDTYDVSVFYEEDEDPVVTI